MDLPYTVDLKNRAYMFLYFCVSNFVVATYGYCRRKDNFLKYDTTIFYTFSYFCFISSQKQSLH